MIDTVFCSLCGEEKTCVCSEGEDNLDINICQSCLEELVNEAMQDGWHLFGTTSDVEDEVDLIESAKDAVLKEFDVKV